MGVNDLLKHLPGGKIYQHDFYKLNMDDKEVLIDAAGLLWQCAAKHGTDYLAGNYTPALIEFAQHLNFLRSICRWCGSLYFDGMDNPNKRFEDSRREQKRTNATDVYGKIKNTPEYIVLAAQVAKLMKIKYYVSKEEADPHVSYESMTKGLTPVTGDSDLIAYGVDTKIIIVHSWQQAWYRIIDLDTPTEVGEYPLYDLYKDHGKIIFQLYAACLGCDFTEQKCGINGIGFAKFMTIASAVEGKLDAKSFSHAMWDNDSMRPIAIQNGMETEAELEAYLQGVVNVFRDTTIYDEHSNTISLTGVTKETATNKSKQHMEGSVHPKTLQPLSNDILGKMNKLENAQLLHNTATSALNIRGATLPQGKTAAQSTVAQLRDFVAARDGKASLNKPQLIPLVEQYLFIGEQVDITLVDRNPNPNGLAYATIDASGERNVRQILQDTLQAASKTEEDRDTYNLVKETCDLFDNGFFDDKYDNIALTAPELPEGLIYKSHAHIGCSIDSKNIGDAFKRCLYNNETASYHGMAFVPDSNRVIILSKAHASMARDEKTRHQTPDYEQPKKQQYLVILELHYKETNEIEHKHSLGVFVEVGRSYCAGCIAGQGPCRHRAERLWHQYHYWSDERLGVDRPPTLDACSWAPGGKKLASEVHLNIHQLQTVKLEKNVKQQSLKMERNHQRNSTKGRSSDHVTHVGDRKQNPNSKLQFSMDRPCVSAFFESLRKSS